MTNALAAFAQVALVDVALAGDNAVIVGALAAGLPSPQRRIALTVGILGAMGARIALSLLAGVLLLIPGMKLVGGALLFWVAWKMWQQLRASEEQVSTTWLPVSLASAIGSIVVADVSMSLDNVIGVAGAADGHLVAMCFGLVLSVILMGVGATIIAGLMQKHRWIGYVGLGLILLIAVRMVFGL